jgi:uncharacterized protein
MDVPNHARIVEALHDAYGRSDWMAMGRLYTPDVTYLIPGDNPIAGVHRGRQNVLALWRRIQRYTRALPMRGGTLETIAGTRYVVLLGETAGEVDHRPLAYRVAVAYRIRAHRVDEVSSMVNDEGDYNRYWIAASKAAGAAAKGK